MRVSHEDPYQAIIDAAAKRGCDLIAMASHGRRGMAAVVLGSQTQKVLTHSTTPVLCIASRPDVRVARRPCAVRVARRASGVGRRLPLAAGAQLFHTPQDPAGGGAGLGALQP